MWFECAWCEQILPLYFVDEQSAKYTSLEEWICFDCGWDARNEGNEEDPFLWDDDDDLWDYDDDD